VMLVRDGERCAMARLATAGIGPVTVRLRDAEAILEERGLGDAAIAAAAEKAAELVEPMSDQHGSADFRRHLTGVLTRRAVHKALKDRHDAASA
jgi:aerobic carbon-monoxide dehydrogenase medium subunit